MFVKRWTGEESSKSSKELVASEGGSEPEGVGLMVANEEEEGSAEWVGVGGRDTGSPLGVSFSSSELSQASSSEGKRGKLFAVTVSVNSASCKKVQIRRPGTKTTTDHFVQVLGYSLPPVFNLLPQLLFVHVFNYGIASHHRWRLLHPSISHEMKPRHAEIKDIIDQKKGEGNLI